MDYEAEYKKLKDVSERYYAASLEEIRILKAVTSLMSDENKRLEKKLAG